MGDGTIESFEFGIEPESRPQSSKAYRNIPVASIMQNTEKQQPCPHRRGCRCGHHAARCGIRSSKPQEKNVWAIGVDKDQSDLNPDAVLCSMFKRVDHGVYLVIQSFMEGKFEGDVYEFGLDFEAVGYSDAAGNLSNEVKSLADLYAKAIIAGDIYVPKNREEFEEFKVPEEGLI